MRVVRWRRKEGGTGRKEESGANEDGGKRTKGRMEVDGTTEKDEVGMRKVEWSGKKERGIGGITGEI